MNKSQAVCYSGDCGGEGVKNLIQKLPQWPLSDNKLIHKSLSSSGILNVCTVAELKDAF